MRVHRVMCVRDTLRFERLISTSHSAYLDVLVELALPLVWYMIKIITGCVYNTLLRHFRPSSTLDDELCTIEHKVIIWVY